MTVCQFMHFAELDDLLATVATFTLFTFNNQSKMSIYNENLKVMNK